MKILIIDQDTISSSKLKLVLSKYGECEIAQTGEIALDLFQKAHDMSEPHGFISMEMDIKDIPGPQLTETIRKLETDKKIHPDSRAKILMILPEGDQNTPSLEGKDVVFLAKPYDRKKLEGILSQLNLEKSPIQIEKKEATPIEQITAAPEISAKTVKTDPKEAEIALKKINIIINALTNNAEQLKGADIPKMLFELVKNGGEEAELLLAQLMTSEKLPPNVRQELIRAAGFIRSQHFIVILNKILNSEDNIKVIQEAIIAVGKYDNQRALNILNQCLTKFKNPMVLNEVRGEIAKIKKNNPILAILPRFLQAYNNPKNFRVTLDILKKIVTPQDVPLFLNYMKSGNELLEDGTFEILCYAGDSSIKTQVFNYFEDRIQSIAMIDEPECNELYNLVSNLQLYVHKDSSLAEGIANELMELFSRVKDVRIKQSIIATLAKSKRTESLEFLKTIYNQEKDFNEEIIEQLSGNQNAVDFLFEKYHQGQVLKEKVMGSLLKSEQGLQYFLKNFFTFELDKQEFILKNITFTKEPFFLDFIVKIYQSNLYSLKFQLLRVLKTNYIFQFKDLLFDEKHQREFMFMGNDYLDTIIELFPITSTRMFFSRMTDEDVSNSKVVKYLSKISVISPYEPVIPLNDPQLINKLFNRILNSNNPDLSTMFFLSLENIKFLDVKSYKYLVDATNAFQEVKGENIHSKETGAISRLKARLREQLQDIREIEALQKDMQAVFASAPIDVDRLDKLIESNMKAVGLKIHHVTPYIASYLKHGVAHEDQLHAFYAKYPLLARMIKYIASQNKEPEIKEDWTDPAGRLEFLSHFKDELRVIISFKEKRKSALIMDQINNTLPEFQVLLDEPNLRETDFLICDHIWLKEYADKKTLHTNRIFLYLENRLDFAPFRAFNPKVFMKPVSGYRVIRMLLQELYIPR